MTPVLQVFARAPVAGACKTRLIPALGAEGAARLARALIRHALGTATTWRAALPGARVELWCAPDSGHPFFADCVRDFAVEPHEQGGGDLGARMWRATCGALVRGDLPILIGTDCPWLDVPMFEAMRAALARHDAAFVPALDGGYVAVGLARAVPELFTGVAWGASTVMTATRARIREVGARHWEGAPLPDIDVPADLARLSGLPALAHLAAP
jgi:rSAM/selenodomain-associated transferase 1